MRKPIITARIATPASDPATIPMMGPAPGPSSPFEDGVADSVAAEFTVGTGVDVTKAKEVDGGALEEVVGAEVCVLTSFDDEDEDEEVVVGRVDVEEDDEDDVDDEDELVLLLSSNPRPLVEDELDELDADLDDDVEWLAFLLVSLSFSSSESAALALDDPVDPEPREPSVSSSSPPSLDPKSNLLEYSLLFSSSFPSMKDRMSLAVKVSSSPRFAVSAR